MDATAHRKLTLLYASSLTVMSGATIAPALPLIERAFAGTPHLSILVPLVLAMPSLFIAVGSWPAGLAVDRWGRKPLLVGGAALYAVAGTAGLWLDDLHLILLSRAVLGIAVAGVMTATTTLIGDQFRGDARTRFLGLQAAFMGLGGIVFLVGGGALADLSWRGPFLIYLVSAGVVPAGLLLVREPERTAPAITREGRRKGTERPGTVVLVYALGFLGMLVFFLIPIRVPFLLQEISGSSKLEVGVVIAVGTVFAAVGSVLHRRLAGRFRRTNLVTAILALHAAGFGILAVAGSALATAAGVSVSGLGTGLLLPVLNGWILEVAPRSARGRYVGGLTSSFFLGQFVSPLATGPLIGPLGLGGTFGAVAIGMAGIAVGSAIAGRRA